MRGDREPVRRIDLRQLFDHDHVADQIETGASQLLRPWYTQESELSHLLDALPRKLRRGIVLRSDRRDICARELADHLAHLKVLLAKIQGVVHEGSVGAG